MKRLFQLLSLVFATATIKTANAQSGLPPPPMMFITEIMYNPVNGADSLEFIEVIAYLPSTWNLEDTRITSGVEFQFPSGFTVNDYGSNVIVIARDSIAFENAFGIPALQWDTGSELTSSESIVLSNSTYTSIWDSVHYESSSPWPMANGNGQSLVLCGSVYDNNNPANWSTSSNPTGIILNSVTGPGPPLPVEVYADPGVVNECSPVSIEEITETEMFRVYPNPSNGRISIAIQNGLEEAMLSLHNSAGAMVYHEKLAANSTIIERGLNLSSGLYIIELETDEKHQAQYLIVN